MSDYTRIYGIYPNHAPEMSLDVWGGVTKAGTPIKLYKGDLSFQNCQFLIVDTEGRRPKGDESDREYLIISMSSGLFVTCNGDSKPITIESRNVTDTSVRWKVLPAGNGAFYIKSMSGNMQLNVAWASKDSGTDVICYIPSTDSNAQFNLKSIY